MQELRIKGIKKIAEITICGALHISVNECNGHTDFIVPTPEQRKNLKEMMPRIIIQKKPLPSLKKWSAEHPVKTRQSEFLKLFPNADVQNDVIRICPKKIDQNSITDEECSGLGQKGIPGIS